MTTPERPGRVRITAPVTGRPRRTTVVAEIDEGTGVGDAYMRSLLRSQFRLALGMTVVLISTVGLLPYAFAHIAWLRHDRVIGIPLAWVILGAGCYPVLLLIAWRYIRSAERNERDFSDLVQRFDQ
jgi:hypothetical protein